MNDDLVYLFGGWAPIGRTVLVGAVTYVGILLLLRLTGNRTLSRLRTFDFIVAVAVGAVFGRTLTAPDVSAVQAITAIVSLQHLAAWLKLRSRGAARLLASDPVVLYLGGAFEQHAMHRERLSEDDVFEAARQKGHASLDEISVIVLEPNGAMSFLKDAAGAAVPDLPR